MEEFSGLKNKLLAERVREQIYQYILNTPIQIGEKLPNEFELAEKYGVGRSTIREAVKLLVSSGILEVKRGSGTYVISTISAELDPLGLSGIEDKTTLAMDIVNIRIILEPGIAELAALNATEANIEKLRKLCSIVETKIAKGENYVEDDIAFHICVAECSQNKVVEQLLPIIDTSVMMFVNVTHNKLTQETIMTHKAITDAIADHDPVRAKAAMVMHISFNRDLIKSTLQKRTEE
jgi:DNA-binding FadR family transcriptional regulator